MCNTHGSGKGQIGQCNCCGISRRCFLASSAASMAVPLMASASAAGEKSNSNLGEHLDIRQFRPAPKVKILSAVVRQKPPYWLGWPGTSYDLEGHRAEYARCFAGISKSLGVDLIEEPQPLENDEAVEKFVTKLKAEKPDAVLLSLQHLGTWQWVDSISRVGVPTIVFAPVGTAFTQHVKEISRRPGIHVISSLETSGVEQALRMVRAKRQMEESRVLVVARDKRNESVLERLGTKIRYVPRPMLNETFEKMPETDEAREIAASMIKGAEKVVEPSEEDVLNAARSYMTAKRLLRDEESNAITTDCLGMVSSRVVPTPPCMAASLFQDAGVTYGCEADLFAAISLMFVSYLFDKPGFQNDPVPETVKNLLITAHCSSGTRMKGFDTDPEPYILRSHSESDIGIALQSLWKEEQPVTLVRFQNPNELILDTGTVVSNVNTPPAGGCRTSFEIAMDRVEDARDVLGFHQVVFYGNHRRDVQAFCQMYGIKVVNSPQYAPQSQEV